jgi:hypothetical protein
MRARFGHAHHISPDRTLHRSPHRFSERIISYYCAENDRRIVERDEMGCRQGSATLVVGYVLDASQCPHICVSSLSLRHRTIPSEKIGCHVAPPHDASHPCA